jgi:hypothetical protein
MDRAIPAADNANTTKKGLCLGKSVEGHPTTIMKISMDRIRKLDVPAQAGAASF